MELRAKRLSAVIFFIVASAAVRSAYGAAANSWTGRQQQHLLRSCHAIGICPSSRAIRLPPICLSLVIITALFLLCDSLLGCSFGARS